VTSPNGSGPQRDLMAHLNFHIQPGPDGKPWCQLTIETSIASARFLLNQDTVEQWGAELPKTFRDLIHLMKSAASGLVIANPNDLHNLKKPGAN
jgi:hypothetical protein